MIYTPDTPQSPPEDVVMADGEGNDNEEHNVTDPGCRGIMIDYDYASKLNQKHGKIQGSFGGRTVSQ